MPSKLPTGEDDDPHFFERLKELLEYKKKHGNWDKMIKNNKSLYKYLEYVRKKYRTKPDHCAWRKRHLEEIGYKLESANSIAKLKPTKHNITPNWKATLDKAKISQNKEEMDWLINLLSHYSNGKEFIENTKFNSTTEYLLKFLQVGDIHPSECTENAPKHDIRHALAFIVNPNLVRSCKDKNRQALHHPSWRFLANGDIRKLKILPQFTPTICSQEMCGNTIYFGPECFARDFFDGAIDDVPKWIRDYVAGDGEASGSSANELVDWIKDCDFFDHYPVPLKGTDTSAGFERLTSTTRCGPRRLHLSMSCGEPTYSNRFKCKLFEAYSYTLSFVQAPFNGSRSFEIYPGILHLGEKIWLELNDYLTPVSKLCPPNGAQVLTYFGKFDGEIDKRKDTDPTMAVDAKNNSQIAGSNVIVVTLLCPQLVSLWGGDSAANSRLVDSFVVEPRSVYIHDPMDDLQYYHSAEFFKEVNGNGYNASKDLVRVAITYRWLGNRLAFLGEDYNGDRKFMQAMGAPKHEIKKRVHNKELQAEYNKLLKSGRRRNK